MVNLFFGRPPAGTQQPLRSGPMLLRTTALAGVLTVVNSLLLRSNARAQDTAASPTTEPPASRIVIVGEGDYNYDSVTLRGFPNPLVSTPQTITVITPQLRQDEAVTSLRDSLRNVSGISIGAGEGSYQGDNYSVRGFAGRSDTFIDGMRDFGSYFRDPFDTENIEVLKGASSAEFGRGSSGGAVNLVTKQPELHLFTTASALYGTNDTKRGTVDFNEPIPNLPGAAFRLNLMGEDAGVTDRDFVRYNRWAVAPSLVFGLGTATRFYVDFLHQSESDRPDYGIPYYFGKPAPVDRSNYYGFQDDYFDADVNIGTLIFEQDFCDGFTLHEQFRLASYGRNLRVTQAQLPDGITPATPLKSIEVDRVVIDGVSTDRDIDEDINLVWRKESGFFKNTATAGFEYVHQFVDPRRIEPTWVDVPGTSLVDPSEPAKFPGTGVIGTEVNGAVDNYSGYVLDTLDLGKQWSAIGSVRYDEVRATYEQSVAPASAYAASGAAASWRGALVYQPVPSGSIYAAAGTSFHPNAEQLAIDNESPLPDSFKKLRNGHNLDVEAGTKWDFLHDHLSFSSAVFWDELTNPATEDADDDLLYVVHGKEHIPGAEFGLVGHLTDKWQVFANYTYMHARVSSASDHRLVGHAVLNTPDHSGSLWTTYDLPWKFTAGFGFDAVSSRAAEESSDTPGGPINHGPGYFIFNAMVKYPLNAHVALQMNVTNFTNAEYTDGVHPGHAVPGEGRTLYVSTNFAF